MSDPPKRPADPRDGGPYYIDGQCPNCGTGLVQDGEAEANGWHDEWVCPECQDGVHMDWPQSEWDRIEERVENADPDDYIPLSDDNE